MFKKKNKQIPPNEEKAPDGTMPLIAHLNDLRKRVMYSMYFFGAIFVVCYIFSADIVNIIKSPIVEPLNKYTDQVVFNTENEENADFPIDCKCRAVSDTAKSEPGKDNTINIIGNLSVTPASPDNGTDKINKNVELSCHCEKSVKAEKKNSPLIFISITEVFMTELKAALYSALFFSVPFFLIQIGIFVIPALYAKEKKIFFIFSTGGYFFFILGALFGYFVVFPYGFDFFLGLTKPGEIVPYISVENYLSFALTMLLSFGIVFELPLVILVVVRMGLVQPWFFVKNFRYFMVVIVVVAAILTPPDPMSLVFMALPLVILYSFGICLAYLVAKKKPDE